MFAQEEPVPPHIKKEVRDLVRQGVSNDIIGSFYDLTDDQINDIVNPPEERTAIVDLAPDLFEKIEEQKQPQQTQIEELPEGTLETITPKEEELTPRQTAATFADLAEIIASSCGELSEDEKELIKLKAMAKPLQEKAQLAKNDVPKAQSRGQPLWSFLIPKEQIALRRLDYQIKQLTDKIKPEVECRVDKVEEILNEQGLTVVRKKGKRDTGTLMLENFP
jgi:hypothetical protein